MMRSLALRRGMSDSVARLAASPGGGGPPTARWQDKSRKVRRGRAGEECRHIRHLAQGATAHDSLPLCATPWQFSTMRTSCAPAS